MDKLTQEALGNLVDPEAISGIRPLQPPIVEKIDISKFILCQNFDKEWQRRERTMERYKHKVDSLHGRLIQSDEEIEDMKKALNKVDPNTGFFGGPPSKPSDPTPEQAQSYNEEVTKYNDRLQQARRLRERIDDTIDKRRDILERYEDAVREAEERLEELTEEALRVIDDDIVAVLDKATQVAIKFAGSEKPEDLMVALEICFIELKIFNSFEEHIEENAARRTAQERISEVNALCAELSKKEIVRNFFVNLFRLNSSPIEKNAELYPRVIEVIDGIDQETLSEMTQAFHSIFGKKFYTKFDYEGIIDPSKLDDVMAEMHNTIDALKVHISKVTELEASTQEVAEAAVIIHNDLESILETMKNNVEEVSEYLISKEHFTCEILDEEVIEDFYRRDLRPSITALREHLVSNIGQEIFDVIVTETDDRFSVEKVEVAIKGADCLRLQAERDKVSGYVNKRSNQIKSIETHVEKAKQVPKKNAEGFKSSVSMLYLMSCFPVLGFVFPMVIYSKIKKFALAFKSPLEIYHKLGNEILAKNRTMQKVVLALGGILGLGGMGIFFNTGIGTEIATSVGISSLIAVNVGFPGVVMVFYLITWTILFIAGKTLQSYIGISKDAS